MTLTEFLLARIAEDEAVARTAVIYDAEWTAHPDDVGQYVRAGRANVLSGAASVLPHVARWDPARVLAECQAKRQIVGAHYPVDPCDAHDPTTGATEWCETLRALALPFADHPDVSPDWRIS